MGKTKRVCTGIVSSPFTADFIVLGETIRLKWTPNDEITHRTVYCWNRVVKSTTKLGCMSLFQFLGRYIFGSTRRNLVGGER
jgi:hypothetical protein